MTKSIRSRSLPAPEPSKKTNWFDFVLILLSLPSFPPLRFFHFGASILHAFRIRTCPHFLHFLLRLIVGSDPSTWFFPFLVSPEQEISWDLKVRLAIDSHRHWVLQNPCVFAFFGFSFSFLLHPYTTGRHRNQKIRGQDQLQESYVATDSLTLQSSRRWLRLTLYWHLCIALLPGLIPFACWLPSLE